MFGYLSRNKLWTATVTVVGGTVGFINNSDADIPLTLSAKPPPKAQQGKVVWVVGASSGIGASLAVDLARDGAKVIISARREKQLQDVAARCVEAGGETPTILPLDVSNFFEHNQAVKKVLDQHGKIDILILNAGISQRNLAIDTPLSVTEDIIKTNFLSFVSLTKAVLPSMTEKKSGKIVVISSLAGWIGLPISTSYSASKFALNGFYNGIRPEVAGDNIQISIVCPGPVESEIATKAHKNPNLPDHEDGKKMPTERCTELILRGIYHNQKEMWISEPPFLGMAYMAAYFPFLARYYVETKLGPQRVHALKTGQAIYGDASNK